MIESFLNLFKSYRDTNEENIMLERRLNRKILECNAKDNKIKKLRKELEKYEQSKVRN